MAKIIRVGDMVEYRAAPLCSPIRARVTAIHADFKVSLRGYPKRDDFPIGCLTKVD